MIVTTPNQRGSFQLFGSASFGECDECHRYAVRYRTGRRRKSKDGHGNSPCRPEMLCERCGGRLSTHEDPMGVMTCVNGSSE